MAATAEIITVRDLIEKLQELPEQLKSLPIQLETEYDGQLTSGHLRTVRAVVGENKIWWSPDTIVLSTEY